MRSIYSAIAQWWWYINYKKDNVQYHENVHKRFLQMLSGRWVTIYGRESFDGDNLSNVNEGCVAQFNYVFTACCHLLPDVWHVLSRSGNKKKKPEHEQLIIIPKSKSSCCYRFTVLLFSMIFNLVNEALRKVTKINIRNIVDLQNIIVNYYMPKTL